MEGRRRDLVARIVYSEEEIVKGFLDQSENYKALKKIKKMSKGNKKGAHGGNSIFPNFCYQLHFSEEQRISDMKEVKTFSDLFQLTGIPINDLDNSYAATLLNVAKNVWQKANFEYYMLQLANEINDYAKANFYSLSAWQCKHDKP